MKAKEFSKLKQADINKMRARYESKRTEYQALSLDELKELYKTKMSSTDRHALTMITNEKLQVEEAIKIKEVQEHDNIEGE